jgi:hypothetical protein
MAEALPPPREVVVIPGADHYFDGHLDALQGAVAGWARRRPWLEDVGSGDTGAGRAPRAAPG